MTPELALQEAVASVLIAAPAVAGLVHGRVFDEVPNKAPTPYVYLGPMNRTRVQIDCGQVWTIKARLYCISVEFGRQEAWDVVEAMTQALDGIEPALPAPYTLQSPIQVTQAGDVVDPLAPKSVFVDLTATIAKDN